MWWCWWYIWRRRRAYDNEERNIGGFLESLWGRLSVHNGQAPISRGLAQDIKNQIRAVPGRGVMRYAVAMLQTERAFLRYHGFMGQHMHSRRTLPGNYVSCTNTNHQLKTDKMPIVIKILFQELEGAHQHWLTERLTDPTAGLFERRYLGISKKTIFLSISSYHRALWHCWTLWEQLTRMPHHMYKDNSHRIGFHSETSTSESKPSLSIWYECDRVEGDVLEEVVSIIGLSNLIIFWPWDLK